VAAESLLRSQLGDTMYVSRWCRGGIARARLQYTRWLANSWIFERGMPEIAEI
jgi:hypothetical protein